MSLQQKVQRINENIHGDLQDRRMEVEDDTGDGYQLRRNHGHHGHLHQIEQELTPSAVTGAKNETLDEQEIE